MLNSNTVILDATIDQPDWGQGIDVLASKKASIDAWHDRSALAEFPQFFNLSREDQLEKYIDLHRCSMNLSEPIYFAERYTFWYDVFFNQTTYSLTPRQH